MDQAKPSARLRGFAMAQMVTNPKESNAAPRVDSQRCLPAGRHPDEWATDERRYLEESMAKSATSNRTVALNQG
ncbi:MAG: hypothetical protein IPL41_07580 [Micropruina sp.]|nr:hypothetical protein [Micropruina sp.]